MRWTQIILFALLSCAFFQKVWAIKVQNGIVMFESENEAANYAFASFWNYAPPDSRKEEYEKADKIVENLWPHFCRRYPECDKMPKPKILFSYNPGSGSFGMGYEGRLRQTNAIILSYELTDNEKDMEFVLAHEMIHYFERHAESDGLREEISSIRRQSYDHCLDYPWPLEELKDDLLNLIDIMDELGDKPHLVDYKLGLPVDGELGDVLEKMIEKTKGNMGCSQLPSKYFEFQSRVKRGGYLYDNDEKIKKFLADAENCFSLYPGNLLKDSVESLRIDLAGSNPRTWPELDGLLGTDGPELERLIRIRNTRYQSYLALSRKLSGPQLRYQTEEDIADIKALNILLESGRRGLHEHIDYLLIDLPSTEAIRCRADLERGVEPSYGPLNRKHHGECWRIWRAKKVEERFLRNLSEQNDTETPQQ